MIDTPEAMRKEIISIIQKMPHDVTDAYVKLLFELWAERAEKLILEISLEKPKYSLVWINTRPGFFYGVAPGFRFCVRSNYQGYYEAMFDGKCFETLEAAKVHCEEHFNKHFQ
jgi:hypothetical protein